MYLNVHVAAWWPTFLQYVSQTVTITHEKPPLTIPAKFIICPFQRKKYLCEIVYVHNSLNYKVRWKEQSFYSLYIVQCTIWGHVIEESESCWLLSFSYELRTRYCLTVGSHGLCPLIMPYPSSTLEVGCSNAEHCFNWSSNSSMIEVTCHACMGRLQCYTVHVIWYSISNVVEMIEWQATEGYGNDLLTISALTLHACYSMQTTSLCKRDHACTVRVYKYSSTVNMPYI